MSKFAANTSTSVEKSKAEIERTVRRYGATGFSSSWHGSMAKIEFVCADRLIRFVMQLPDRAAFSRSGQHQILRTQTAANTAWEQACRQKWRALALLVKAKLEAVDSKIATLEEAFFANVVMPDGRTVYESAREHVAIAYQTKQAVQLLGGPSQ